MEPIESHGGVAKPASFKGVFFIISIPVILALAAGVWLSIQVFGGAGESVRLAKIDEANSQARMLVDSFWGGMDAIRARALALHDVRSAQVRAGQEVLAVPLHPLMHWAELEVAGGALRAVKQSVTAESTTQLPAQLNDQRYIDFYLSAAVKQLSLDEIARNGVGILRVQQDFHRSDEWLALAFALPESAGSVVLALVGPAEVFPVFGRMSSRSEGGSLRGYLIGSDGRVLLHSQQSYVGADFGPLELFSGAIKPMLLGQRLNGSGNYSAVDRISVAAAYYRPGTLPFALVVERILPLEYFAVPLEKLTKRTVRSILVVLGALLFLTFLCAFWLRRRKTIEPTAALQEPMFVEPPSLKHPGKITHDLTQTAGEILGCRTMFFAYQPSLNEAVLRECAGFGADEIPAGISFSLTSAALRYVAESEQDGEFASFAEYPPLVRLLLNHFGLVRFDAWVVSSFDGGSAASAGRILGVLVAIDPGEVQGERQMVLAQMFRNARQSYEKTPLSH